MIIRIYNPGHGCPFQVVAFTAVTFAFGIVCLNGACVWMNLISSSCAHHELVSKEPSSTLEVNKAKEFRFAVDEAATCLFTSGFRPITWSIARVPG